ncbi:MAG TPA: hypothetical protein VNO31_00590 [Umezawaea sp.]|nr:hypothetical protein [Umezawaea sp.]
MSRTITEHDLSSDCGAILRAVADGLDGRAGGLGRAAHRSIAAVRAPSD